MSTQQCRIITKNIVIFHPIEKMMSEIPGHSVEVWNWLVPAWNFGAYITSLFEWRALSAIGTFAAVCIALMRDRSTEVLQLDKDAATLDAMTSYVEAVALYIGKRPLGFPELAGEPAPTTPAQRKEAKAEVQQVIDS
ncbi:MAG: hypothetical protein Q8O54_11805, partial [Brevundimonas sp.]|nr:hypothetical protein [Brevundimonas sp.]